MSPFVTVLIDTYNYGQYIEEAVESVLAQEFPREQREILVVDDGSTDDTEERLKKYGDEIRYVRKPNGGQASAFNLGFAEARGEIVATLDADDVWLPDKLRRMCETFEKNPDAGMVYHRTYLWRGGEELEFDSHFAEVSGRVPENPVALLVYAMVSTSCLAFRRNVLHKLLPIPETLRTQADAFLTALIIFVAPVLALPEFLAKYRIHGANRFYMTEIDSKLARDRVEHRMAMRSALSAEIKSWIGRNGHDLASQDVRAYLKQWAKAQETDSFTLHRPHRWNYFLHLLEYPRVYGKTMSSRHRLYSYMRAFGALLLGYDRLYLLDDFQKGYKEFFRRPTHKSVFSQKNTEATARN